MTRDEIIAKNPIVEYVQSTGRTIYKGAGGELLCQCFMHSPDKHPSMRINAAKQTFYCDVCDKGGSVIDLEMIGTGGNVKAAMARLSGEDGNAPKASPARKVEPADKPAKAKVNLKKVDEYHYKNAMGNDLYVVERHEGVDDTGRKVKEFPQWHMVDGKKVWGITGVERTLFMLPEILNEPEITIAEGEKCVKACWAIDYPATCNSGGSSGWLDALGKHFIDKDVIVMPDADEPGVKWLASVMESIKGKCKSVRIVKMPEPHNDVADVVNVVGVKEAGLLVRRLVAKAPNLIKGYDLPLEFAAQAFKRYREDAKAREKGSAIDLGLWLPSIRHHIPWVVRGDVIIILADTSHGKSAVMVNLSCVIKRPSVFFELELTNESLVRRYASRANSMTYEAVEFAARNDKPVSFDGLDHVVFCKSRSLSIEGIKATIQQSELLLGVKPECVYIDYIGLVKGAGSSRYDKATRVAEDIKTLAVECNVVVFASVQMHRKENESPVPTIHSCRDSGQIEASAQVILGVWRPDEMNTMCVNVLKATDGTRGGSIIECNFFPEHMLINERAKGVPSEIDTDAI